MTSTPASLPQRLYAITLGARDVATQRHFYEAWGWQAASYTTDEYVAFDVGGLMLAFYPTQQLAKEAAPAEKDLSSAVWNRITLAVNLPQREDVDQVWQNAVNAGATAIGRPEDRPWGGRSGYIADPEGNRWEVVWVPPALLAGG
ncbi:MAG TPA: VOC family protein [Dehalococcoidia bacterium]|nr:VOC family protein [Dehalococcoidia bacterium]